MGITRSSISDLWIFVKQIIFQGIEDQTPRLSAALAFYTVFSLAPILIVAIALTGMIFGPEKALTQAIDQIQQLFGREIASTVQFMIEASLKLSSNVLAMIIGVTSLLIGTTGALGELRDGLNRIWKVETPKGFIYLLRERLVSVVFVAGVAFLLLVSLMISAVLSAIAALMHHQGTFRETLWHGTDFLFSTVVLTTAFAMMFKMLPEVAIPWSDVWIGGAVSAILFAGGKILMGLYLGKEAITSTYGAAGSFMALLLWVYYSSFILYLGAEFTKAYADHYGSRRPKAPRARSSHHLSDFVRDRRF